MTGLFSGAGVVFALVAALFWWRSSTVRLPVIGNAWGGIFNVDEFYAAIKKVADQNKYAARRGAVGSTSNKGYFIVAHQGSLRPGSGSRPSHCRIACSLTYDGGNAWASVSLSSGIASQSSASPRLSRAQSRAPGSRPT
jgi:hypothetical protein